MSAIPLSAVRCVLLDAVGTLFTPDPPLAMAYQAAGRSVGVDLEAAVIAERFRQAYRTHFDGQGSPTSEDLERTKWRCVVADVFPESKAVDRVLDQLWQHFAQPQSWRLAEDAQPSLAAIIARGYEIAIASNFDARLRAICAGRALPVAVHRVFVSSEIGYSKPHPKFFESVAQQLGREPHELLLIGDDPLHDVAGAQAAGWQACLLDRDLSAIATSRLVRTLTDILPFLPGAPAP